MDLKILKFLVTVLICSRLTHQITTPEDRCQISESGFVCIDCFTKGTCLLNEEDETYSVILESSCQNTPTQYYCDDTISHPQSFGSCSLLDADATACSCSSSAQCIADINNPAVVLHCEADTPVSDPPCLFPSLNLDTCNCASYSDEICLFTKQPGDDCTSYYVINPDDNTLTGPIYCSSGTCFNQTACKCVKNELTCTAGCPFVANPDGNCRSYFVCTETETGNGLTPLNCSETLCFDQESCRCVPATESTTIPATCPPGCPFVDDPNDDCKSYFVCTGTGLTQVNCSDTLCFDQESCGCLPATASTTVPPTCPPGCPLVDDPNDNCQSYFVCTGNGVTKVNCSDTLCFDQESCGCVPATELTTIPQLTCSQDCPFVDNPNDDCTSYYLCSDGNELIPLTCADELCFDQGSCSCVDKELWPTCSEECPFQDDPNDECVSYYLCDGKELIPLTCSDDLCFDQASCACVDAEVLLPKPPVIVTEPLTMPLILTHCSSDCPYLDDPYDNCKNYYFCDDGLLTPYQCPESLCFDESTCGCQ